MNKNVEDFIEEFTTNFAELFVETFFVRYLSDYNKDDLVKHVKQTEKILNSKIKSNIDSKFKSMNIIK